MNDLPGTFSQPGLGLPGRPDLNERCLPRVSSRRVPRDSILAPKVRGVNNADLGRAVNASD